MKSKLPGLVVSGSSGNWLVEQRLDLSELFGRSSLPDNFKLRVGQKIIDLMLERIDANKAADGSSKLASYDPDYVASDEFKAFGKSKNDVDMDLTGDMLNNITIKDVDGDSILIGWDDQENNAKAHGHMTGANGSGRLPVREFFGANEKLLEDVKDQFIEELGSDDKEEDAFAMLSALEVLKKSESSNSNNLIDFFFRPENDDF